MKTNGEDDEIEIRYNSDEREKYRWEGYIAADFIGFWELADWKENKEKGAALQILRDLVKELDHKEADRQYNLETRRATAMRHARETKEKLEKRKRKLVAKETEVGSGGFRLKNLFVPLPKQIERLKVKINETEDLYTRYLYRAMTSMEDVPTRERATPSAPLDELEREYREWIKGEYGRLEKKLAENKGKSWRVADIKGWITGLEEEEKWIEKTFQT